MDDDVAGPTGAEALCRHDRRAKVEVVGAQSNVSAGPRAARERGRVDDGGIDDQVFGRDQHVTGVGRAADRRSYERAAPQTNIIGDEAHVASSAAPDASRCEAGREGRCARRINIKLAAVEFDTSPGP
ncbi:MAG: hypothetical protein ACK53I_00185, partial [Phenylobacterium sp.]